MSDIPSNPSNPSNPQDDLYKYYDQPAQVPVRPDQQTAQQFHQEVYTNPNNGNIHIERGRGDGALNIYVTNENININGRPSDQCVPRQDGAPNYSQYCAPYRNYPVDYYNYPYRPTVAPSPGFAPFPPSVFYPPRIAEADRFHDRDRFYDRDRFVVPPVPPVAVVPPVAPYYAGSTPYYAGSTPYYAGGAPYYASGAPAYYAGGADYAGGATPFQWAGLAATTGLDAFAISQLLGRRR